MIKVSFDVKPGDIVITLKGHGRADVCAASTMLINSLQTCYKWLSRRYPREIKLTVGKKPK